MRRSKTKKKKKPFIGTLDDVVTSLHGLANTLYAMDRPGYDDEVMEGFLAAFISKSVVDRWLDEFDLRGLFKWLVPWALANPLSFFEEHENVLRQMRKLLAHDLKESGGVSDDVFDVGALFLEKAAELLRKHADRIRKEEGRR